MKAKLYWEFYKSTLALNWGASLLFTLMRLPHYVSMLPLMLVSVGPFLSFFYKELAQKQEYYFYHNRSISKLKLVLVCTFLNVLSALLLLILFHHVKPA